MLTLSSTHLVIISYDEKTEENFGVPRERIKNFYQEHNPDQITLLIGKHFAHFSNLVDYYLPKAAIDRIQGKAIDIKRKRYLNKSEPTKENKNE